MIPLQSYQILIHEVFFQIYDEEFILMKTVSFFYISFFQLHSFFTFLNEATFKNKIH